MASDFEQPATVASAVTTLDPHMNEAERALLYRRTLIVVVASQVFSGAGLSAGIAVGALLAAEMIGNDGLVGIPVALFTAGSAAAALLIGRSTQRSGRRHGLAFGYVAGSIGGFGVVLAAVLDSVPLLLLCLLIYGAGTATNLQARYAGTDLALPHRKATAVSVVMVSTTAGAVAGPNLVEVMGNVAVASDIPRLAGPFLLAGVAYLLAGAVVFLLLRPDPYIEAKRWVPDAASATKSVHRPIAHGVTVGAAVMLFAQMVMVAIMTMTAVHMHDHGHSLSATGFVISMHIGFMYLPSLISGLLVDRFGRVFTASAAAVVLALAGLVAAASPPESMAGMAFALSLLGAGWNLGIISGTAMIADSAAPQTRARTQGNVDLLLALAGASGGALSGLVAAVSGYSTLSLLGGALGLALLPVVAWSARTGSAPAR